MKKYILTAEKFILKNFGLCVLASLALGCLIGIIICWEAIF